MKYMIAIAQKTNRTRWLRGVVCPMHIHRYMELVLVTEGVLEMEIGQNRYRIAQGEAVLVEELEPHSFLSDQPNQCIVIEFTRQMHPLVSEWLQAHRVDCKRFTVPELCYRFVCERIPREPTLYNGYDAVQMQAFLAPLIDSFLSQCEGKAARKEYDDRFIEVLEYIMQNLDEDLSLASVAEQMGMRADSLSRAFSQRCDLSFHAFIQSLRLCEACSMIWNGMPIAEAAMRSGFGSICSFNRVFKQQLGMTPSEFKRSGSVSPNYLSHDLEALADEYDPNVRYLQEETV